MSAGGTSDTRWELPGPCSRVVGMLVQGTASLRLRSRMFTYAVQGFVERSLVFEAEVLGIIV